jgi:hypothetical protein
MPRTLKTATEQMTTHQVIWADLRSKQGFVVRMKGRMVTARSLRWRTFEAVVNKNENFVTAARQNKSYGPNSTPTA